MELGLGWGVTPAVWLPLLRLAEPLDQPQHQCLLLFGLKAPLLARFYLYQDAYQLIDLLDDEIAGLELCKGSRQPLKVLKDMGCFIIWQGMGPASQPLEACHHGLLVETIQLRLEMGPVDDVVLHLQVVIADIGLLVLTCSLVADESWPLGHNCSSLLTDNLCQRGNQALAEGEPKQQLSEATYGRACHLRSSKFIKTSCKPH